MANKASGPASVAEGLGNVLSAITDTMKAPDATQFAGELMKLQTGVLDLIHGGLNKAGGPGAPGAAPGGPPPPGGAPPGGGPAPGGPPGAAPPSLMGGIAGLQGQGQGPSKAAGNMGGIDPEEMRQLVAAGADNQ